MFWSRDQSLITGRGVGYNTVGRGGVKFYPNKHGEGRNSFSHAWGGGGMRVRGAQKGWGSFIIGA